MVIINASEYATPYLASDALNNGDKLYFPASTYILEGQTVAWGVFYACLQPTKANLEIYGDSADTSILKYNGFASGVVICLNKAGGDILIHDLGFTALAREERQGPAGISLGEMGATENSGNLGNVEIKNCKMSGMSFDVHGGLCDSLYIHDCEFRDVGGLPYPSNFSESICNTATVAKKMTSLIIDNCTIYPDETNGDHVVYLFPHADYVQITNCTFKRNRNATIKLYSNALGGYDINKLVIANNTFECTNEAALTFVGHGICGEAIIKNNVVPNSGMTIFNEWFYDNIDIDGIKFQADNNFIFSSSPVIGGRFRLKNAEGIYSKINPVIGVYVSNANISYIDNSILNSAQPSEKYALFGFSGKTNYINKVDSNSTIIPEEDDDMAYDIGNTAKTIPCAMYVYFDSTSAAGPDTTVIGKRYPVISSCMREGYLRIYTILENFVVQEWNLDNPGSNMHVEYPASLAPTV